MSSSKLNSAMSDPNGTIDRIEKLEGALRFLIEETRWKSVDKDNMEFEGRVTCYQLDRARAALERS